MKPQDLTTIEERCRQSSSIPLPQPVLSMVVHDIPALISTVRALQTELAKAKKDYAELHDKYMDELPCHDQ